MRALCLACLVMMVSFATAALAEAPDMTGTWECELEGIIRGKNIHYKGKNPNKALLIDGKARHVIEDQSGRRFWGHKVVKGGKKEPIIGMVMFDDKTIVTVDTDGKSMGKILGPDRYEEYYSHTWGESKMAVFGARCKRAE